MPLGNDLKREARVAFSTKVQPVWFRLVKWAIILVLVMLFWRSRYFWWSVLGVFAIALALHGLWRWKTKNWTQAWGGWNDLDAGRK